MTDGGLKINSLSFCNCFSYRNVLQNGVKTLSEMVFENSSFCHKAQNFVHFRPYDLVQISSACSPNTYEIWKDFRLPVSEFATVARKSFNGKFTAKIDFPIGHFMLPLLTLTLEV